MHTFTIWFWKTKREHPQLFTTRAKSLDDAEALLIREHKAVHGIKAERDGEHYKTYHDAYQ